jgi:two-component system, chemotaxis family, protein-glutamate methylesterase/glutaminase
MRPRHGASQTHANDRRSPQHGPAGTAGAISVIGICASVGGPRALELVLSRIPADYATPILVVQHMAPGFIGGLVEWIGARIAVPVRLAADGEPLRGGVTFAPDGAHLVLDNANSTRLDSETDAGRHRPSGDMLLESLARVAAGRAVAVVLTGMGSDGARGLAAVGAAGGRTIAQDEPSSVVYGMPRAAAELGAQRILAPQAIGAELAAIGKRRAHL